VYWDLPFVAQLSTTKLVQNNASHFWMTIVSRTLRTSTLGLTWLGMHRTQRVGGAIRRGLWLKTLIALTWLPCRCPKTNVSEAPQGFRSLTKLHAGTIGPGSRNSQVYWTLPFVAKISLFNLLLEWLNVPLGTAMLLPTRNVKQHVRSCKLQGGMMKIINQPAIEALIAGSDRAGKQISTQLETLELIFLSRHLFANLNCPRTRTQGDC